jgi:hypothetical protein
LNRHKEKYDWDNDEVAEEEGMLEDEPYPELAAEIPGIELEDEQVGPVSAVQETEMSEAEMAIAAAVNSNLSEITGVPANDIPNTVDEAMIVTDDEDGGDEEDDEVEYVVHPPCPDPVVEDLTNEGEVDEPPDLADDSDSEDEDDDEPERFPDRITDQPVRQRKKPDRYSPSLYQEGQIHVNTEEHDVSPLTETKSIEDALGIIMLQQYNINKGLKMFGDRGATAVTKELTQLYDMETCFPEDSSKLTNKEKSDALYALILLTEKRNGDIKGRACVDGSKQRDYSNKEDAALPTASLEGILITVAIDVHEGRDVAVIDIPGAYLHTLTDEKIVMLLKGKTAELMAAVNPKLYRKYIAYDKKGNALLYVRMHKALYGLLRSAMLFYRKLIGISKSTVSF